MPRQLKFKMTYKSVKNNDDSVEELDFSDDDAPASFRDLIPDSNSDLADDEENAAIDARAKVRGEPTEDDLAPEILIREDGAVSPQEAGDDTAADQKLTLVNADKIGAGSGLDEAELAEVDPVNNKVKHKKTRRKTNRTSR